MAKNRTFKVADQVGRLVVDFRPITSFSGTIPEPSQQQLNAWQVGLSQIASDYSYAGDPNDLTAVAEFMAELSSEDLDEQAERTADLYAELCSNEPSKDQILELPPRYRQAFYGYVSGELAPEASRPVGNS